MAIALLRHAIRLVLTNWRDALKISAVLYFMQAGFGAVVAFGVHPTPGEPSVGASLIVIAASIVQAIINIWIAVAWHRFVLLDETPNNYVPMFDGGRVLRYVGRWILIGLVGGGIGIVGVIAFTLFSLAGATIIVIPLAIVLGIFLVIIGYRLGLVLPASSVDDALTLRDAWNATKGTTWLIIRLTLLSIVGVIVLALPAIIVTVIFRSTTPNLFVEIWSTILGWFILMVGVALLTTMYGYYVQHRPIDGMPIPPGAVPPPVPPAPDPAPAADAGA